MTDYLLVHGAGQGAWSWGPVWGHLTAPEEHPPNLHKKRKANRVHLMDLPGHGADASGDTSAVRLEECIQAIMEAVGRESLEDVVLVGHGFAGSLVLRAACEMDVPPKRIVMVAGIVPDQERPLLSAYSAKARTGFKLFSMLSSLSRQELKLPNSAIYRVLCNGMDPMQVAKFVGFFGPLPTRVLRSYLSMNTLELPCPLTYVVLNNDKLFPPDLQAGVAGRLEATEIVRIDSCHQVMAERPRELAEILLRYA